MNRSVDVDFQNPNFNSNKEQAPKAVFMNSHAAWHRTFDKAKERQMLGQGGDPAQ